MKVLESISELPFNTIERLLKIPYDIIDRYEIKPFKSWSVLNVPPPHTRSKSVILKYTEVPRRGFNEVVFGHDNDLKKYW